MHRTNGFTLIELMITVAIIAIIAAIAYPSYQDQVRKSNRAEGKMALMQTAQALERCYTANSSFDLTKCTAVTLPTMSEHGRYQITITPTAPTTSYTLNAIPQGAQAKDTKCGTLKYTDTNQKQQTGSASQSECW